MSEIIIKDIFLEFPFENDNYLQVFTTIETKIIGTAKVECWAEGAGYHPFISKVWVDPDYRRRGIGERMMVYIINKVTKNENKSLALYVHNDNLVARRLYEKLGFFAVTADPDMQILYAKEIN